MNHHHKQQTVLKRRSSGCVAARSFSVLVLRWTPRTDFSWCPKSPETTSGFIPLWLWSRNSQVPSRKLVLECPWSQKYLRAWPQGPRWMLLQSKESGSSHLSLIRVDRAPVHQGKKQYGVASFPAPTYDFPFNGCNLGSGKRALSL